MDTEHQDRVRCSTLLAEVEQALNDWIITYAAEHCTPAQVKAARKRISERGGTLAYVTDLRERVHSVNICLGELAIAVAALERISRCEDAPAIDATGECQTGLHCGVEDRGCCDRYDSADYGYTVGVEKGLEWSSNEAKHALDKIRLLGVRRIETDA